MGFNLDKNQKKVFADINVTPMVDVMLVLLVIFIAMAPMMFNGIQLSLPKTSKVSRLELGAEQIILSVTEEGEYYLGKVHLDPAELVLSIKRQFKKSKTEVLYIRAHQNLKYGKVAELMALLKSQGIGQIAMVTEVKTEK